MDKKEFEEKKKEILKPIFLSKEEGLDLREKDLKKREKYCKGLEIINKQLKEICDNADVQMGNMIREFELRNPPSKETKDYVTKLWEYMCKESLKIFSSSYENYREFEDKKANSIKKYKDKIYHYQEKIRGLDKVKTKDANQVNDGGKE